MSKVFEEKDYYVELLDYIRKKNRPAGTTIEYQRILDSLKAQINLKSNNVADMEYEKKLKIDLNNLLHNACHNGHAEIAELLINNGADVNNIYPKGVTPLDIAIGESDMVIANLLIENGVKPSQKQIQLLANHYQAQKNTNNPNTFFEPSNNYNEEARQDSKEQQRKNKEEEEGESSCKLM